MRLGIFSVVDHYPAELPRTSAQFYGELLELAIQWFKGITARSPFAGFLPLRRVCRCSHLWAPSYSVGTAGQVSAETIRRSIARAAHVRTRR